MNLILKIRALIILLLFGVNISFSQGQDIKLGVYKNILTGDGEYHVNQVRVNFNPASAVLVVIDFWDNVAPQPIVNNTLNLISLARTMDIPVIFFSHEKPLNSHVVVSEKDIILDGSSIVLENYLYNNGLDVKTILFAGFHTAECLTITRLNSVSRIAWRSPQYQLVVVKDCTFTGYWQYLWAITSIQTRYYTTTLNALAFALSPSAFESQNELPFHAMDRSQMNYSSSRLEDYRRQYKPNLVPEDNSEQDNSSKFEGLENLLTYDSTFGREENWKKSALVVVNPSTQISSKVWEKRARTNIHRNVARVVQFARRKNMEVVYFTEDNLVDASLKAEESEKKFAHPDSMFSYLSTREIDKLVYVGNITNSSHHFTPMDAWRFTIFNGGFKAVFLEDCLITNEIPATLEKQIFKKLFLETAMFYRPQYQVSTLSILYRNLPELSINEVLLDPQNGKLTVEIFNAGGLPLDISRFSYAKEQSPPLRSVSTSPKLLTPGQFYLQELSYEEVSLDPDHEGFLYLIDRYSHAVDSIPISKDKRSIGKFPNGGLAVLSYEIPSLGQSNYEIDQEKALCADEGKVKLKVTKGEGLTYAWSLNGSSDQLADTPEVMIQDEGLYSVTLNYGEEVVTTSIDVKANALPESKWQMDGNLNFCATNRPLLYVDAAADHKYYWMQDDVIVGTQSQFQVQETGNYSLMVENEYGCTNESEPVLLTKQEEGSCIEQRVIISPNPSDGKINLLINDASTIQKIEVYDMSGRIILQNKNFSQKTFPNGASVYDIDLSDDLKRGTYLLLIKGLDLYHAERISISQ